MPEKTKILFFISKESIYFQVTMEEFKKLLTALEAVQPFTYEIIDVNEHPDMTETHKIDALPTMIIGNKRFIGKPDVDKIVTMLKKKENE